MMMLASTLLGNIALLKLAAVVYVVMLGVEIIIRLVAICPSSGWKWRWRLLRGTIRHTPGLFFADILTSALLKTALIWLGLHLCCLLENYLS